jgi:hypothetical protein
MEYVSPEYKKQLDDLAESLMKNSRRAGQLSLFNVVEIPVEYAPNDGDDFGFPGCEWRDVSNVIPFPHRKPEGPQEAA